MEACIIEKAQDKQPLTQTVWQATLVYCFCKTNMHVCKVNCFWLFFSLWLALCCKVYNKAE